MCWPLVLALFAKYEWTKTIVEKGDGSAKVYEAEKDSEKVCIKVVLGKPTSSAATDLKAEYSKLKALAHPHILKAVDFVKSGYYCALVTELMDTDVYGLLDSAFDGGLTTLTTDGVKAVCRQLISLVCTLHEEFRTAHLSIKPENIFVKFPEGTHPSGRPWEAKDYYDAEHTLKFRTVLGDLGLASASRDSANRLLCYRGASGARGYMAPEILDDSHFVAESVDIFALGRTLFTTIIGFPPWEEASASKDPFFAAWKQGQFAIFWESMRHHCTTWEISDDFASILTAMMSLSSKRPTCRQVLGHPFFMEAS